MASTATALLDVARAQIGTMEGRDRNGNWNNLQKFGEWYAKEISNPGFNGVPWCDIFISWVAAHSGNGDIIPLSAYVPGRLGWARSKGLTGHWPPEPGDIGIVAGRQYIGNGQTAPYYAHVFYVEKYLGNGVVQTIEGNTNSGGSAQGNGVYRLHRHDSESGTGYIYIRPQYAAQAPTKPATPSTPATPDKPAPKAKTKIRARNLYKGAKNDPANGDVEQYNRVVWNAVKAEVPDFAKAHEAAWMKESSQVYGWETAEATYALYRNLQRKYPKSPDWGTLPTHSKSDWCTPGPKLLQALGFWVYPA